MKKYGPRRGRAQARSTIKFQLGLVDGMTGVYSRTATTGGMSMVQVQQSCSYKMVYLGAVRFLAFLLCYHYATFRTGLLGWRVLSAGKVFNAAWTILSVAATSAEGPTARGRQATRIYMFIYNASDK